MQVKERIIWARPEQECGFAALSLVLAASSRPGLPNAARRIN
jgi:hypothetical protein